MIDASTLSARIAALPLRDERIAARDQMLDHLSTGPTPNHG